MQLGAHELVSRISISCNNLTRKSILPEHVKLPNGLKNIFSIHQPLTHSNQTDNITDVPPSQRFDEDRLLQYLRSNIDIFPSSGTLKVKKFGFGQSNPTYLLECNKLQLVLRKKPFGKILRSAHAIEREYRVMSALQNSKVPVPKTYILCSDASIIGTPFYIYEFIKGRVFTSSQLPSLRSQQRFAVYAELQKVFKPYIYMLIPHIYFRMIIFRFYRPFILSIYRVLDYQTTRNQKPIMFHE